MKYTIVRKERRSAETIEAQRRNSKNPDTLSNYVFITVGSLDLDHAQLDDINGLYESIVETYGEGEYQLRRSAGRAGGWPIALEIGEPVGYEF